MLQAEEVANDTTQQLAVKSQLYLFHSEKQQWLKHRRMRPKRQFSTIDLLNPDQQAPYHKGPSTLTPKLPSKKLCEEPRFFMSLERKKERITDGLQSICGNLVKSPRNHLEGSIQKYRSRSFCRKTSLGVFESQKMQMQTCRSGWHPNKKTPFLNFNMEYLIRKRKSMTPLPSRQGLRLCETIRISRRN